MIGTDFLIIILLWCGDPNLHRSHYANQVDKCRREKIACVSKLPKGFDNSDVVNKCLLGER